MSVNQVVRSVGSSLGSVIGGLMLAVGTTGEVPNDGAYTVAAWIGATIMLITALTCVVLQRKSLAT